jgi:single-strand DNA-binding protein
VAWGKLAEICGQYLPKSNQVYIERSIRTGNWKDRDGNEVKSHDPPPLTARFVQMLSPTANANGIWPKGTPPTQAPQPADNDTLILEEEASEEIPF